MPVDYLLLFTVVVAVLGALSTFLVRSKPHASATVASFAALMTSVGGLLMALTALLGDGTYAGAQWDTVFGTFSLSLDRLGAFFLLIVSLLMVAVSIFSAGYLRSRQGRFGTGTVGFLFIWFVLSIVLLPMCGNAVLFLVLWEVMSLTSFLLVMADGRDRRSVTSALTYAVMTHAGTALIMVGFILLWFYTGSTSFEFSVFTAQASAVPGEIRSVAFVLFLIGFGTKAGMIPLHVWLPYAHPAAPSNVSALMSGVIVKIAIFMLIRCYFDFLGVTDTWWGLLVLLVGWISALLGVMYALMETDIKRVLAYSTVENVGIILIGLGAAMVFQSYGLYRFRRPGPHRRSVPRPEPRPVQGPIVHGRRVDPFRHGRHQGHGEPRWAGPRMKWTGGPVLHRRPVHLGHTAVQRLRQRMADIPVAAALLQLQRCGGQPADPHRGGGTGPDRGAGGGLFRPPVRHHFPGPARGSGPPRPRRCP